MFTINNSDRAIDKENLLPEVKQWLSHLIVVLGIGYLVLIPTGLIKKKFEPIDIGLLTALLVTNSGLIDRISQVSVGKDGFSAEISKEVSQQIQIREDKDLELLQTIDLQLSETILPQEKITYSTLKQKINQASPTVAEYIFYRAKRVRHKASLIKREAQKEGNHNYKRGLIERTIPIFQALVDSEHGKKRHRFYAQLGYALKDQETPNWDDAEGQLDQAIKYWIDENPNSDLPPYYCFNWILCVLEQARNNNFEKQYRKGTQKLIRERFKAFTACSGLKEFLDREEIFHYWKIKNADWLNLDNIFETSSGDCWRDSDNSKIIVRPTAKA